MDLTQLKDLAARHVPTDQPDGAAVVLPMDGIFIVRHLTPAPFQSLSIGPFASLILQGQKEVRLDDKPMVFSEGQTSVLGHDIPIEYCIAQGSHEKPFLAILFQLNFEILHRLKGRIDALSDGEETATSLRRVEEDTALIGALGRYIELIDNPVEREILGPAILEEMHLRLLQSHSAGILRELLSQNSHASKIAQFIEFIRSNLKEPLSVDAIATTVGMGKSAFYEHFHQFTGKSPMSFAKMLRLQEARHQITALQKPVSAAAFAVGYASASQFSRDYKQHFGVSPSVDQQ